MKNNKGIIFYTDNRISNPIRSIVRNSIKQANLPIVSTSLKKIPFGKNIVVEGQRSYPTMVNQIIVALENLDTKYVFFCEHDVVYSLEHFDFIPPKDNIFYYNSNVYRWWIGAKNVIRYDRMLPLSVLCVNREFALKHYKMRQRKIEEWGLDKFRSREPRLARKWGYEPGTKKKRRGGITDDDFGTWYSKKPVIDLRYKGTFSAPKIHLSDFKHKPKNWEEIPIEDIPGIDLKKMFNLK